MIDATTYQGLYRLDPTAAAATYKRQDPRGTYTSLSLTRVGRRALDAKELADDPRLSTAEMLFVIRADDPGAAITQNPENEDQVVAVDEVTGASVTWIVVVVTPGPFRAFWSLACRRATS